MKKIILSIFICATTAVTALYPVAAFALGDATPPSGSSAVATPATVPAPASGVPADTTPPVNPAEPPAATPPPAIQTQLPAAVTAPTQTTPAATPLAPATVAQGPTAPTGADANKYVYNPATGKYENDQYTWDPATNQTAPKIAPTYSYNPATGQWDTTKWVYDAPSGTYIANVITAPVLPAGASLASDPATAQAARSQGIATTGPDSTNTVQGSSTTNANFNLFYNAAISNKINSNAATGDAAVIQNTLGGSAATGNALSLANVINLLQSTWMPAGGFNTFNATIAGNVTGDLVVNPATITGSGPGSTQVVDSQNNNNLRVVAQGTGTINNDINLKAASGNALVSGNTTAGDATTGNATAMANIVNAISSSIAAGKSFLGVITITGNLNGDILLPPGLLDSLIASSGPNSNNTITGTTNNTVDAKLTNNQLINNNVTAGATTGGATVANNTTAGSGTSGSATTKVNILNLTGRQIIGKDAILVFVNVLGKWTGLIVNAPAGATSAAIGGGLGTNTINSANNNNTTINATDTSTINNNVNVNAASGNAAVTGNTQAGNAKSGNASATVNIANIEGSNLSFSDWFGILFINVFGSWTGSFGVNTDAGNPPIASGGGATSSSAPAAPAGAGPVLSFVPKSTARTTARAYSGVAAVTPQIDDQTSVNQQPKVLAATSNNKPTPPSVNTSKPMNLAWIPFAGSGLGIALLLVEEIARRRKLITIA